MSEWKKVKLGEITSIKTGKLDSNAAVSNGAYPFFTCDPTTLSIDKWAYDTEAILLAGNNASGNYTAKYYKGKFNAYQRTYIIETLDPQFASVRFLAYAMNQQLQLLKVMSSGSTTKFLTMKMLTQLSIILPSIKTQHRIATILSRYDSLIENYQKQIKLLEEAAQRLYKEWFVDLHFPGHENTKIIDGVPEGWEYRKIGDVYKTVLGGTPSRAKSNYWGGDIPWINSGEINKLRIIQASEMITQEGYDNSSTKLMPVHTTILAITGATLGQVSYTEIETCANQSVVGIIDETNQTNEYLYLYINDNILSIVNKATGGAQQHINKDIVNDYNILIPVQNVLALFKERTTPLFKLIKDYLNSIQSLTEARDRLLPKLMSGELKV